MTAVEIQVEQGSQEWHDLRSGKITASCFRFVMGSPAAQRSYLRLLRGQRSGPPQGMKSLEHGKRHEDAARADFEFETGLVVRQVGLVVHPELPEVAASPDGLIDADNAGLEIKCPSNSEIHISTVTRKSMPKEHYAQVQGGMWITRRARWHFVSFDPRQPRHLRRFRQVIPRDEAYIAMLDRRVRQFREMLLAGTEPADVDVMTARIPFL